MSRKHKEQALTIRQERALTAKEFLDLADVPPEVEWFANLTNPRTRRAYQIDLQRDASLGAWSLHISGLRAST